MKKQDVRIGACYRARVGGKLTVVRIDREKIHVTGGRRLVRWAATNVATGREVTIKSASKLRYEVELLEDGKIRRVREREKASFPLPFWRLAGYSSLVKRTRPPPHLPTGDKIMTDTAATLATTARHLRNKISNVESLIGTEDSCAERNMLRQELQELNRHLDRVRARLLKAIALKQW